MTQKHSLKAWFIATRPWAFPASGLPVVVTLAFLFMHHRPVDWVLGLLTVLTVVMFHAAGNTWSDYFDFIKGVDREDTVGGTSMTSGEFQPSEIKALAIGLLTVSIALVAYLIVMSGVTALYFAIVGVILTLLYPWTKYRAMGEVNIFLTYSILPILGAGFVATGEIYYPLIAIAVPLGLITVAILFINNTRDMDQDRRAGIRTLAMMLGRQKSAYVYSLMILVSFAWIVGLVAMGEMHWIALISLLALKDAFANVSRAFRGVHEGITAYTGLDEATAILLTKFSVLLTVAFVIAAYL